MIKIIGSYKNKVQISKFVKMPQLHTLLHFHLAPIMMINGSSCHDLILDFQYFFHSILCKEGKSLVISVVFGLWSKTSKEVIIGEHSSWSGLPI